MENTGDKNTKGMERVGDKLTYVNIFLASSLDELRMDRLALGDYVRKLNDIYVERGVFFRLFMCEDEDIAMADGRKQEQYNAWLGNSQICIVLVFNRAGAYTVEEFNTAYEHMKASGSPAIITFFRQGLDCAPEESVRSFMERLDKELGHYFTVYEHIDSVKLRLLMQVKLMDLDVPIEFRGGKALIGGVEALTLENIPAFVKNANFQRLRAEYEELERVFQAAKARYLANPEDDGGFLAAGERRNQAKKALEDMEEHLYELLLGAEKGAKEHLTPRQREAYALVEQGRSREADEILNREEILADAAHKEKMADLARESIAENVAELLQKIAIVQTRLDDDTRFDRILQLYEDAVALEERNGLEKTAMLEYCVYLGNQRAYQRAQYWMERYKKHMELDGTEDEIASACNNLGIQYKDTGRFQEAEKEYLRAKEIYEKLAAENPGAYLPDLAMICNNLGTLYSDTGRFQEAEKEYLRAKEIYEKLAAENPGAYLPDLAMTCNNLGVLYSDMGCQQAAEAEYLQAKEIYEKSAAETPGAYLPDLATTCNGLGNLYSDTGRLQEAETEYLRAKEIREKLAAENPGAYLPDLAATCNDLGNLYSDTGRFQEAEKEYLRAKEIREKLATETPGAYLPDLAATCNNLGILYSDTGRMRKAEAEYLRAKEIREKLAAENPGAYLPDLAGICNNLGNLYKNMGRKQNAEAKYLRAKEIREKLAAQNPQAYLPKLINVYNNLIILYGEGMGDEARAQQLREEMEQLQAKLDALGEGQ